MKVDVYPVGVLRDLKQAHLYWSHPHRANHVTRAADSMIKRERFHHHKHAWRLLRRSLSSMLRNVRQHKWRALKNQFNGYLAEPDEFPPGDYRRRCGTGWTKSRAMRSLHKRLP